MRKIILLFFISLAIFLFPQKINAADFSTTYNVKYLISENQNTNVSINITLANRTDIYYATSYKILVGFEDIKNVKASDKLGNILTKVEKQEEENVINVSFNEKVVGQGNKLNFTISFDTGDVAKKLGNIWEVNIPGISEKSDITEFGVQVVVPKSLGKPSFIKPKIESENIKDNVLNFTRKDLGTSGISLTFGNEQIFDLGLLYHIENKNVFPIKTEIALPPQTNYQEIQIEDINPKPLNVYIDDDGNWLAEYNLSPSEKKDIKVIVKARVKLSPDTKTESENRLASYLKPQKFWETTDPKIKEKAKQLKTPYEIYKFVSEHLTYDYSRVTSEKPRIGGVRALASPKSAVCLEFTDLFIAIARSAGIPAREVDGFAYTENSKERPLSLVKDVLHAWPQFYDREKKTWIMIDPTWANTTGGLDYFDTFDFDHIAFVIKGADSTYPIPAGGYKLPENLSSKDVNVAFSNAGLDDNSSRLEIEGNFPKRIIAGFSSKGEIVVKNTGKKISSPQKVTLQTSVLSPRSQSIEISSIPPYGESLVPVNFEETPFLTNREDTIRMVVAGNIFLEDIKISPFFLSEWGILGGAVFLGIFIIVISIIAFKSGNLPFSKWKKRSPLRGEGQEPQEKS